MPLLFASYHRRFRSAGAQLGFSERLGGEVDHFPVVPEMQYFLCTPARA